MVEGATDCAGVDDPTGTTIDETGASGSCPLAFGFGYCCALGVENREVVEANADNLGELTREDDAPLAESGTDPEADSVVPDTPFCAESAPIRARSVASYGTHEITPIRPNLSTILHAKKSYIIHNTSTTRICVSTRRFRGTMVKQNCIPITSTWIKKRIR